MVEAAKRGGAALHDFGSHPMMVVNQKEDGVDRGAFCEENRRPEKETELPPDALYVIGAGTRVEQASRKILEPLIEDHLRSSLGCRRTTPTRFSSSSSTLVGAGHLSRLAIYYEGLGVRRVGNSELPVRGLIDRESAGGYALNDEGRAVLEALLMRAATSG